MTRRRFYAPPTGFAADEKSVTLSAEETRHARDVLRLQSGDVAIKRPQTDVQLGGERRTAHRIAVTMEKLD